MTFPIHRPRRLRRTEALRSLVRETQLTTSGLIYPMFACPGTEVRVPVNSMPGVYQQSPDQILEECREVADLGVPGLGRPMGRCSARLQRSAKRIST